MPTLFHGTGHIDANMMVITVIDVSLGGGEFGRGFYTQYSQRHALAWAYRRGAQINGNPCVLRIDIDDQEYGILQALYLNNVSGPALTVFLDNTAQQDSFVHANSYDVSGGPIMGNAARRQQKFESQVSQDLLNTPNTTKYVMP